MTAPKKKSQLSKLGDSAEKVLTDVLADMRDDIKKPVADRRYTLTDHMKVVDRVAKFEAIRAQIKTEGDEGSFFKQGGADES